MSCKNLSSGYNNAYHYDASRQFTDGYSMPVMQPYTPLAQSPNNPQPMPYSAQAMAQPRPQAMAQPAQPTPRTQAMAQPAQPMPRPQAMAQPAQPAPTPQAMAQPAQPAPTPQPVAQAAQPAPTPQPVARPALPTPTPPAFAPYGGAYNARTFTVVLSPTPTAVPFDAALPASGITFAPGMLTTRESGTYEISYEMLLYSDVSVNIKVTMLGNGVELPSATQTRYAAIGRTTAIAHSTFATMPSGAALTMQLAADEKSEAQILLSQITLRRIG